MTYCRVIPRDLFNEADLLKCLGRLYIELENTRDHTAELCDEMGQREGFKIEQNEDSGAIYCTNAVLRIGGQRCRLERPLNSREPWPLWLEGIGDDPDFEAERVFTDEGKLSPEFLALIQRPALTSYKRGNGDYAAQRDLASDPNQQPAEVSEEEYYEMLEILPPIYAKGVRGFLVMEALSGDERGQVHANYYEEGGKFFARYHCLSWTDARRLIDA